MGLDERQHIAFLAFLAVLTPGDLIEERHTRRWGARVTAVGRGSRR